MSHHSNSHECSCHRQHDQHDQSCTCCCCTGTCKQSLTHHHVEECGFSKQLLELADEAWMEVLKEKIKEQIESKSGKYLEKLAKLVSDANHQRWKNKLALKKEVRDFKQQIDDFFGHK